MSSTASSVAESAENPPTLRPCHKGPSTSLALRLTAALSGAVVVPAVQAEGSAF